MIKSIKIGIISSMLLSFILLVSCTTSTSSTEISNENDIPATETYSNTSSDISQHSNSIISSTSTMNEPASTTKQDVYFDVVFKDYDDTVLDSQRVKEGDIPLYSKSAPTRSNDDNYKYNFSGWNPKVDTITSDITYIAQYERVDLPYTISFDLDGGESSTGVSTIKLETLSNDKFKFDITKPKYVFKGWSYNNTQVFDENGNIINNIQLQPTMTFKAIYQESTINLTITYSVYNPKTNELLETYNNPTTLGEISETSSYSWNTQVNLFANPKEGYTFVGWYYDGLPLSNISNYNFQMSSDDATIEARFKCTEYYLNIYSNNTDLGQVMIREANNETWYNNQTREEYYTESITVAAYTKTETRFLGWYDENNKLVSTSPVYTFNMINREYTLEAKWNYFTITYDLDGGTNNKNNPTSYNKDMSNITLGVPTKEGYTFQGWEYNDVIVTGIDTSRVCHIELKAIWSANTSTLYKVAHYQQNIDDDNYPDTPFEVDNLTGTTDTLTSASVKTYNGFTSPAITQVNINGDGTTIIELYYVRNTYSITIENNISNAGETTGAGSYKYGKQVTINVSTNLGYNYSKMYINNTFVTDDNIYNVKIDKNINIYLEYNIVEELSPFTFESDLNSLTILGVKDRKISSLTIPNYVTSIGSRAFQDCINLNSIIIPNSVLSVGECAFINCYNLISVELPNSITKIEWGTFIDCYSLKTINISSSITLIGERAFSRCISLKKVSLTNGLKSVGFNAFEDCDNLAEVFYIGELSDWLNIDFNNLNSNPMYLNSNSKCYIKDTNGSITYLNCSFSMLLELNIPNSINSIGNNQFAGFNHIVSLTIPNSITTIGTDAFKNCRRIVEIYNLAIDQTILDGLDIKNNALIIHNTINADSIITVDENGYIFAYVNNTGYLIDYIGNDIKLSLPTTFNYNNSLVQEYNVNKYAFYGLSNVISISIPLNVQSIGSYAFSGCIRLVEIYNCSNCDISNTYLAIHESTAEQSIITIDENGFVFVYVNNIGYLVDYTGAEDTLVLPNSFTYNSLEIEDYIINKYAFYGLCDIKSITIPNSISSIGNYSFSKCGSLKRIEISDNVSEIGNNTFDKCMSLLQITIPQSTTIIREDTFNECWSLKYVTIGKNITAIENGSFYRTYPTVLFNGSIGDWVNIDFKGSSSRPHSPTTVYFEDEDGKFEINNVKYSLIKDLDYDYGLSYIGSYQFYGFSIKDLVVSDDVTRIGRCAFEECRDLENVELSSALEYIGNFSFAHCVKLKEIVLPKTLTEIGHQAFYNCTSLDEIHYDGTLEEWSLVVKADEWNCGCPAKEVICSNGKVSLS